jgi:D-alanine transaminase
MLTDVEDNIVYLNGEYLRLGDAKVSVLDRGFIFGDGVYDVVPAYKGKPFRMQEHLDRLERSLAAIRIKPPLLRHEWQELVFELLAKSAVDDSIVYIQVTRGVAKRDHGFPNAVSPSVFCMVSPFIGPTEQMRSVGLSVVTAPDIRWLHCDIKSTSLLGNVLAKQRAVDAGVDEVVQFRDGYLTEGASCNVWVVKNGILLAPPRDNLILAGIRYGLMEELAGALGIPFSSQPISQAEVERADELLVTSATKEVLPVVRIDGRPVGMGRPGPIYAALRAAYDSAIAYI